LLIDCLLLRATFGHSAVRSDPEDLGLFFNNSGRAGNFRAINGS
jgi:hypothetical protein